jgi:hypothetical protein
VADKMHRVLPHPDDALLREHRWRSEQLSRTSCPYWIKRQSMVAPEDARMSHVSAQADAGRWRDWAPDLVMAIWPGDLRNAGGSSRDLALPSRTWATVPAYQNAGRPLRAAVGKDRH